MSPNEVEQHLDYWPINTEHAYKTYTYMGEDFVVIVKHNKDTYVVDNEKSTIRFDKPFDREEMTKLLGNDSFIFVTAVWVDNYRKLRTKGCCCGAVFTVNPNCHSTWCPQYKP